MSNIIRETVNEDIVSQIACARAANSSSDYFLENYFSNSSLDDDEKDEAIVRILMSTRANLLYSDVALFFPLMPKKKLRKLVICAAFITDTEEIADFLRETIAGLHMSPAGLYVLYELIKRNCPLVNYVDPEVYKFVSETMYDSHGQWAKAYVDAYDKSLPLIQKLKNKLFFVFHVCRSAISSKKKR